MRVYGETPALERCVEKAARHIGGKKAARAARYVPSLLMREAIYHDAKYQVRVMAVYEGDELRGAISVQRSGNLQWHESGLHRPGALNALEDGELVGHSIGGLSK